METIETITTTNKDSMEEEEEEDVELASSSSNNNIRPYSDDQHDDEGEKNKVDDANNNDNNKEETTMAATTTTTTKGSTIIANNKPHGRMQHLGASRQYWRDLILGVNDGLVSTFLLVAGVAGGGMTSSAILLTAVSGALAGAVSMAAGEYVATKSQNQVLHGEIALEQFHVVHYKDDELHELQDLLTLIGILESDDNSDNNNNSSEESGTTTIRGDDGEHEQHHDDDNDDNDLRQRLLSFYANNSDALLKIMTALEFGVIDKEERTPYRAGFSSGLLFCLGALPSVLPFVFSGDKPQMGLVTAAICTVIMLLVVGAIKTWATRTRCITAALENLIIAGFGGGLAYGVGVLFDTLLV